MLWLVCVSRAYPIRMTLIHTLSVSFDENSRNTQRNRRQSHVETLCYFVNFFHELLPFDPSSMWFHVFTFSASFASSFWSVEWEILAMWNDVRCLFIACCHRHRCAHATSFQHNNEWYVVPICVHMNTCATIRRCILRWQHKSIIWVLFSSFHFAFSLSLFLSSNFYLFLDARLAGTRSWRHGPSTTRHTHTHTIQRPVNSIDSRERNVKFGAHSAIANDLGERLFFAIDDNNSKNARLQIKNVQDSDGGVYRCRVDFFNSATRNSMINLTLVGMYTQCTYMFARFNFSIFHSFFFSTLYFVAALALSPSSPAQSGYRENKNEYWIEWNLFNGRLWRTLYGEFDNVAMFSIHTKYSPSIWYTEHYL